MKRLTTATTLLTATAATLLGAPASAHHSQSMFDTTKEIVIRWRQWALYIAHASLRTPSVGFTVRP